MPRPTDIILYRYLWRHEHDAGKEDGDKARPCLVLSVNDTAAGMTRVITAPITTREYDPKHSIDLAPFANHLGLDLRSRVVWNDLNVFQWVGPDIVPGRTGSPFLGRMPERIWRRVIDLVVKSRIGPTLRTE